MSKSVEEMWPAGYSSGWIQGVSQWWIRADFKYAVPSSILCWARPDAFYFWCHEELSVARELYDYCTVIISWIIHVELFIWRETESNYIFISSTSPSLSVVVHLVLQVGSLSRNSCKETTPNSSYLLHLKWTRQRKRNVLPYGRLFTVDRLEKESLSCVMMSGPMIASGSPWRQSMEWRLSPQTEVREIPANSTWRLSNLPLVNGMCWFFDWKKLWKSVRSYFWFCIKKFNFIFIKVNLSLFLQTYKLLTCFLTLILAYRHIYLQEMSLLMVLLFWEKNYWLPTQTIFKN